MAKPQELADEFAESVSQFSSYSNWEEPFYPAARGPSLYNSAINRTNDVVLRLARQGKLMPVEAPYPSPNPGADAAVVSVPVNTLACDYVDRELLVQRTSSPAKWSDGSPNVGGLRLDLLMADAVDRTPIVGEIKLPRDMDPFFGLVQGLACAAHLATPSQYRRMQRHLPDGKFPDLRDSPRLDVWVLIVEPRSDQIGQGSAGRYMADLRYAAEALAPRLLAEPGLGAIRRIAELDLKQYGSDEVVSEVHWAWKRSSE